MADPQLHALVAAATARADAADRERAELREQIRDLRAEVRHLDATASTHGAALARIDGGSTAWAKAPPWIALLVSAAGFVVALLR